jgi:hypothetical protein
MYRFRANRRRPLAHIPSAPTISLARKGHMCVTRAHMPLVRASDSRTSPLFRPSLCPDGAKPAEVRAHLPGFPGVSRAHPPGSCHFSDSSSRTSPGFPSASRNPGRNRPRVREQLAGIRHRCARRTHLPRFPAIASSRNGHMCAARTHIPSFPAISLARSGRMCAGPTRAHMRDHVIGSNPPAGKES